MSPKKNVGALSSNRVVVFGRSGNVPEGSYGFSARLPLIRPTGICQSVTGSLLDWCRVLANSR